MSSRSKILIVDDSEMNRSLLSDMLSEQFDIMEASNGKEAAVILHDHESEISLMLLDIVMPEMDGFELLTLMNKNGWIKSIPVIMISAETVPAYVDRAYDLGAMEYISRPFDERTVQHRVVASIMLTAKQKELANMVTQQMYEKEKTNRMMIEVLSNIVEFRNGESGLHVIHVETITGFLLDSLMARTDRYALSKKDVNLICTAAALHDIGKIAIPWNILNKPGRLTDEEFAIMKTHSMEGAKILNEIAQRNTEPLVQYAYQICRWHHERYDGRGYPDGLTGDEIPIAAQVVALADVYDALTSDRVYKKAISHEVAVDMILNEECGSFNPLLMECLREVDPDLQRVIQDTNQDRNSDLAIMRTVDDMVTANELNASERTMHLLRREHTKFQFLSELSRDILFEYTAVPEMITLTSWSADYLGLPTVIMNPREVAEPRMFFKQDMNDLLSALEHTTPEQPLVEKKYSININGQRRWCKVIAQAMWGNSDGIRFEGAIGKIVDVHDDTQTIERLERSVARDSLTGLLNHKAARGRISELLAARTRQQYALVILDLDDFKQVNDRNGHLFGDALLQHIADMLQSSTRSSDVVSRVGGDEFMIFMEYRSTVKPQVERIFHRLSGSFREFPVRLSMGVADAKECNRDYDTLFRMADEAMYSVKFRDKNGICFYNEMDKGGDGN